MITVYQVVVSDVAIDPVIHLVELKIVALERRPRQDSPKGVKIETIAGVCKQLYRSKHLRQRVNTGFLDRSLVNDEQINVVVLGEDASSIVQPDFRPADQRVRRPGADD
jgi:hypothetical protein